MVIRDSSGCFATVMHLYTRTFHFPLWRRQALAFGFHRAACLRPSRTFALTSTVPLRELCSPTHSSVVAALFPLLPRNP